MTCAHSYRHERMGRLAGEQWQSSGTGQPLHLNPASAVREDVIMPDSERDLRKRLISA